MFCLLVFALSPKCIILDPGYNFTWDNTQLEVQARHQSTERRNKMLLWANAFITGNRVSFRHLYHADTVYVPASIIPLDVILPSQDDYDSVRFRMEILVERILCKYIEHFKQYYSEITVAHIPHIYSGEAEKKSQIVSSIILILPG